LSKFIVANLATAFVLIAASAVFAAPDSNTCAPPADQSSASSAAPPAQSQAPFTAAATPASQPTPAQAAKKKSPSDVICKPDAGTGSRVGGVKICLTREQWRERED
jgi:hypothetical protein